MCNPRRIQVTASRQVDEAWQREITRRVELHDRVAGEARVRQNLANTVGRPALLALESVLAAPDSGWVRIDRGFRRDVQDGYVLYDVDERELEIVSTAWADIHGVGEASETVSGRVSGNFEVTGDALIYDDGYGGRTREWGEREADRNAQQNLTGTITAARQRQMQEAEQQRAQELEGEARRRGQEDLNNTAAQRREELAAQARAHMQNVGLRARQEFHRVLAVAYRHAIEAYARQNGAEGWMCTENGQTIEIEFRVSR